MCTTAFFLKVDKTAYYGHFHRPNNILISWLVVLGFNASLTAKVISWRSVTHICFLAFSHQYKQLSFPKPPTIFLACFCRGERRKYIEKKVRLNRGSNSQPPSHESDTLNAEPAGGGLGNNILNSTSYFKG